MKINKEKLVGTVAIFSGLLLLFSFTRKDGDKEKGVLLQDVTLIDGNGGPAQLHMDILIQGNTIANIGKGLYDDKFEVINLYGKTVMPALVSAHSHIGTLKGTAMNGGFYTRENILAQLKKYADYGVTSVMSMGTDRPLIYNSGIRDSSAQGLLPGARIHTAGYGFGVPQGAPPLDFAMDKVYRPKTVAEIPKQMDSLVKVEPELVKIWVDDFGGKYKNKMAPEIYKTIIAEAHKRGLRVAAHAYYLADARELVASGVDIIGHSIRDAVADDAFASELKQKNIWYIPTLSLDEYAFIYARKPEWINDPFFKASLEPGVYDMITSKKYQEDLKNSPAYEKT